MVNRRVLVIAGAVGCICLGLLVLWMLSSHEKPGFTKAHFDRIKVGLAGMTKKEVEAILGKPNLKVAHDDVTSGWGDPKTDRAEIVIWYDEYGRARLKVWRPE